MARFRKQPVVIDAFRLIEGNQSAILEWSTDMFPIVIVREDSDSDEGNVGYTVIKYAEVTTLNGIVRVERGEWIIRGINGEIYPCKPDIFEKTYEAAEARMNSIIGRL